jgi:hypothetical protein
VSYTVTATMGLPDKEQGLATGLATLSQQVAIAIGVPIASAIAATRASFLDGVHLVIGINVAVTVIALVLIWTGLRPRPEALQSPGGAIELAESDIGEREMDASTRKLAEP